MIIMMTILILVILLLTGVYIAYKRYQNKELFPWTTKCRQNYTKEMCQSRSNPILISHQF